MVRSLIALAVVLLAVIGCQSTSGPARDAGTQVVDGVFVVETPVSWEFEVPARPGWPNLVIWTHDPEGRQSQLTFVTGLPPGAAYAPFDGAPRFFPEMTSEEIAQMVLNSHVQHGGHMVAKIDSVVEAPFAGHPGFRFTYSYVTRSDHEVRSAFSGAVVGDRLYLIGYTARAAIFEAGWPDVERIVDSARLLDAG